jgi:hypothetical protein
MNEENVLYMYHGLMILSLEKEGNSHACLLWINFDKIMLQINQSQKDKYNDTYMRYPE